MRGVGTNRPHWLRQHAASSSCARRWMRWMRWITHLDRRGAPPAPANASTRFAAFRPEPHHTIEGTNDR